MITLKEQLAEIEKMMQEARYSEAFRMIEIALPDRKLRVDEALTLLSHQAFIRGEEKRYDEARELFEQAIARAKQNTRMQKMSELYHLSGLNEVAAGNPQAALSLFRKELSLVSSGIEKYFTQLSNNYYEQGCIFFGLDDVNEAKMYYELALAFAETDGTAIAEARAREGLGRCAIAQLRIKDALEHLSDSLTHYNDVKDRNGAMRVRRLMKRAHELKAAEGVKHE